MSDEAASKKWRFRSLRTACHTINRITGRSSQKLFTVLTGSFLKIYRDARATSRLL